MAVLVKNLDNIIGRAIHGPNVDNIPLYTRVDGGQEESLTSSKSNKSDRWDKASKTSFNSPNNIRRVFITGNRVIVQYYKSPIVNGRVSTSGCWRELKFGGVNNMNKSCIKSLSYKQDLSKYYMERQLNPTAIEPDNIVIKGTGIKALASPWVASNIEEIYFDWTVLTSDTFRNAAIGCDELLKHCLRGGRGMVKCNTALDMLLLATSTSLENISSKYSRLRYVGLISGLDKIMASNYNKVTLDLPESTWIKDKGIIEMLKESNSLMVINEVSGIRKNADYALRDGIYKFDDEVLRKHFDSLNRRSRSLTVDKEEVIGGIRDTKSELEVILDEIYENRCIADAKRVLLLSIEGETVSTVNIAFSEMSTEGENKYRKLIKIGGLVK